MYRVSLTDAQRDELRKRLRQPNLEPRTRERLEVVGLVDAGWRLPKIAKHVRRNEETVRIWIRKFLQGGFDALPDQPHLGQKSAIPGAVLQELRAVMEQGDRAWTLPQAVQWLKDEHEIIVTRGWLGELLRRSGWSYKRTQRQLRHKQEPEAVAAGREALTQAEKRASSAQ
jgi:transposase